MQAQRYGCILSINYLPFAAGSESSVSCYLGECRTETEQTPPASACIPYWWPGAGPAYIIYPIYHIVIYNAINCKYYIYHISYMWSVMQYLANMIYCSRLSELLLDQLFLSCHRNYFTLTYTSNTYHIYHNIYYMNIYFWVPDIFRCLNFSSKPRTQYSVHWWSEGQTHSVW